RSAVAVLWDRRRAAGGGGGGAGRPAAVGPGRRWRVAVADGAVLRHAPARHVAGAVPRGRDAGHLGANPVLGGVLAAARRVGFPGAVPLGSSESSKTFLSSCAAQRRSVGTSPAKPARARSACPRPQT